MNYRREIDGLRAIAVLPVILFHARVPGFSGGFVGVDVFFVISGYLITTLITTEMAQERFSLARFYDRRARRILPALFLVVLCCVPFALRWMDPWELRDFARSAGAVALFGSNFYFWNEGSYFTPTGEERPLLHTWSLGVEEQFYLFFPLFLLLVRRWGPRAVFWSVAAFALVGFALAEYGARRYPTATFYLPHTRIWELDIGVLCALVQSRLPRVRPGLATAMSMAGLALIGAAVVLFDERTPFPSAYALAPTLGAALVILYGTTGTATARLLSLTPLVAVGLVSYSAYLWHQPLLVFARMRGIEDGPAVVVLIGLTFVLAYLSWRFVERPFRVSPVRVPRTAVVLFAGTGTAALVAFALIVPATGDPDAPNPDLAGWIQEISGKPFSKYACANPESEVNPQFRSCLIPHEPHRRRIAVFGDSHAGVIFPAFNRLAEERGYDVNIVALGGCPPILGADVRLGNFAAGTCAEVGRRQLSTVVEQKIDTVFLVARWSLYEGLEKNYFVSPEDGDFSRDPVVYRQELERLISSTITQYKALGIDVFIVLQIPQQPVSGKTLYRTLYFRDIPDAAATELIARRSVTRAAHRELQAGMTDLLRQASAGRAEFVDLTDAFCSDEICLIGDADNSRYLDFNHLSQKGAAVAYGALAQLPALGVAP